MTATADLGESNTVAPAPARSTHGVFAQIDRDFNRHVAELQRMIQQPSISANGIGVREMAALLREKVTGLGAQVELVETAGNPIVYGYLDAGAPRTVLFYELYDVQPANEPGWTVPPFAGEIEFLPGHGPAIVGRGAFNSKGCVAGFLNVLEAFRRCCGRPPVNVRFLIEGEEEIGSRSLPDFVTQHVVELRQAECVVMPFFGENAAGKTIICCGLKGLVYLELTCQGGSWGGPAERDIHSMHNAWIANPAWRLVQALATMKGDGEHTVIDGLFDQVCPPNADEQAMLAQLEGTFDAATPLRELSAHRYKWDLQGIELLKRYLYEPSVNLDGIVSGYQGEGTLTVIPHAAHAKVDVRLVPDMTPDHVVAALRRHLDGRGFTDIGIRVQNAYPPSRTSPLAPAMQALIRAARQWAPGPVEIWPRSAGASPQYLFSRVLGLPMVFGGLGHGGRPHSANEYVTVAGLRRHEQGIAAFLLELAGESRPESRS